jgi:hypothetical protein
VNPRHPNRVLVGTQFYTANADAARRQARCAASLLALRDVDVANVQWRDDVYEYPGIETLATLDRDAAAVAGAPGRRKPIVVDLCDALAAAAAARGRRYFALVNGDIIVTQAAIDRIAGSAYQTYAFSRRDLDPQSGRDADIVVFGIDGFAFDVDWWRAHRRRFRAYIFGEPCFDNVFAAIMMAHGRGTIENRRGEIRHERHPSQAGGAFARFNYYLAALDAPHFRMWAHYVAALQQMRERGASDADEQAMLERTFVWKPSRLAAIWHAGRSARAHWRYARDRARLIATASGAPR